MTLSDQFGENITADEVEDAIIATLQQWMPTYVMAMEERKGKPAGTIHRPKGWQVIVDPDTWTGEQLPSIAVVSAGTNDQPGKGSRGTFDATFLTGVVWWIGGNNHDNVRRLNRWYAAIVREVLVQQPVVVGGVRCHLEWMGEEYDVVASDQARTLQAGRNVFTVTVDHVVESDAGPLTPVEDPYAVDAYPDLPTADEVISRPELLED